MDKEVIVLPWEKYFRKYKITKFFNKSDEEIIKEVENTALLNNETIQGKFSDMPIGIGGLSEGCKTLLCINHAIKSGTTTKYMFNITSCGPNAIEYLAASISKSADIHAYCKHADWGIKNCIMSVNGKLFDNCLDASVYYTDLLEEAE